jgi:acyl carrier protein
MTPEEIRSRILKCIRRVAPEVEPDELNEHIPLRDQTEIDSMDYLNIMIAIEKELGVDVPEEDYLRVTTLAEFVGYVSKALERQSDPAARAT